MHDDFLVVVRMGDDYAHVIDSRRNLTISHRLIGAYATRKAAQMVAIMYNRRQRTARSGMRDVLRAVALWWRSRELPLPDSLCDDIGIRGVASRPGWFDISRVFTPADRSAYVRSR